LQADLLLSEFICYQLIRILTNCMHKNVLKHYLLLALSIILWSSCANFKSSKTDYTRNSRNHSTYKRSTTKARTSTNSRASSNSSASSNSNARPRSTSSSVSTKRVKVVNQAYKYIGTKYKYGGKDPRGFDCSGFTSYVMKQSNVKINDGSFNQAKQGRKIPLNATKPGDLVFFGTNGRVSHVGMVVKNAGRQLDVIHSTSTKGVIVQNINTSDYWKKRVLFARNIIED